MMAEKRFILALDQGTTSSRAIVFDHEGQQVALCRQTIKQYYPKPGWVEHDAVEIWESQEKVMREAMAGAAGGLTAEGIAAIGITNQRETTVVWDKKTGVPVHRAIVWQDRRTADYCRELKAKGREDFFAERTGKRLDPYFSGTKVKWILDHVEGARARAEAGDLLFGTIDTWLVWKLTDGKVHVTDASNACRTLMCNITTGDWDEEILNLLEIPRVMLPEIRSCSEVYGETADGIKIAGMAGDQNAALFGQACFERGMAKNTYGTGCFLLMNTGEKLVFSKHDLLSTVAWKLGGKTEYALEGSVFIGGALVQWLQDELELIKDAAECERLAAEVEDNGGLYLVPAFAGLGAPHWDPYARGLAIGITRGTNKRHFCRAALEAVAFQSGELARAMVADSGIEIRELRVDGGASRSETLLQFQSDLLQVEVVRPVEVETTALGAAFLAGLAVGYWANREEVAGLWKRDCVFSPKKKAAEMAGLIRCWEKAVERAKNWEE